ncbi:MAG: FAD-dependent oxidoreductase [Spirochaetes bacterium]|nr:FAD-dependent oxidoreductase [Spirochaetota bacterium]
MNLLQSLTDNIIVDREKCIGCGICVERCPMGNLVMQQAPCRKSCPLGVNAGGYVRLTAMGKDREAYEMILETLPFPGIMGRICSQPCENDCTHQFLGSNSISIRSIKRYLADRFRDDAPLPQRAASSDKEIAVVGAGPAGLMAAYDLLLRGHSVTVFDGAPEPGGMLRWAIPEFRLPLEVLEREIGVLERLGVRYRLSSRIGRDDLGNMAAGYDGVLVATGCGIPRKLGIDGEDAPGVFHALSFLRSLRAGEPVTLSGNIAVIGGGNAAVDAAQAALRKGASRVTMVSLESADELPAFPWALERAVAEGVETMHSWGPVRILADGESVRGVELQRCLQVYDEEGHFRPCFDSCEIVEIQADSVIIAAGQVTDTELTAGSGATDPLTLQVGESNIFVAGDAASGPSTVVASMASGRRAAESIHRLVSGEHLRFGREYAGPVIDAPETPPEGPVRSDRMAMSEKDFSGTGDFGEIELTPREDEVRREAARCLSCGIPCGFYRTCWFCLPCEIECPQNALTVEIPYLLR